MASTYNEVKPQLVATTVQIEKLESGIEKFREGVEKMKDKSSERAMVMIEKYLNDFKGKVSNVLLEMSEISRKVDKAYDDGQKLKQAEVLLQQMQRDHVQALSVKDAEIEALKTKNETFRPELNEARISELIRTTIKSSLRDQAISLPEPRDQMMRDELRAEGEPKTAMTVQSVGPQSSASFPRLGHRADRRVIREMPGYDAMVDETPMGSPTLSSIGQDGMALESIEDDGPEMLKTKATTAGKKRANVPDGTGAGPSRATKRLRPAEVVDLTEESDQIEAHTDEPAANEPAVNGPDSSTESELVNEPTDARGRAMALWKMFSAEGLSEVEEQFLIDQFESRVFAKNATVTGIIQHIDRGVVGGWSKPPPVPGVCFLAHLTKKAQGPGGPSMTQKTCPHCSKWFPKSFPGEVSHCCHVKFAAGVASPFGPRGANGAIASTDREWQRNEPYTVQVHGKGARWILVKRQ